MWERLGYPIYPAGMRDVAVALARAEGNSVFTASASWAKRFRRTHGITTKKSNPQSYKRRCAESEENCGVLADAFEHALKALNIRPEDDTQNKRLWTMDESGIAYRYDKGTKEWVLVLEKTATAQRGRQAQTKHEVTQPAYGPMSVVAACSCAGHTVPPFFLLSGNAPKQYTADSTTKAIRTEKGSMTTKSFIKYLDF